MGLVIVLLILRFAYPKWFELHCRECIYGRLFDFDLFGLSPIFLLIGLIVLSSKIIRLSHHTTAIAHDAVFERVLALYLKTSQPALLCLDITIELVVLVVHYSQIHISQCILPLLTPLLLLLTILVFAFLIL